MHIHVEDSDCCLCTAQAEETSHHFFNECEWFKEVRMEVLQWFGVMLPAGEIKEILEIILKSRWKSFKKEIEAAIMGGLIYHTWRARNGKIFKGRTISRSAVAE